MNLLSICTPTYEMSGKGHIFLEKSFEILIDQTFKDFDVVISDHSKNDLIKKICDKYKNSLNIHYHRNTEGYGSISANANNAIKKAEGKLIKFLWQDDFLYSKDSLKEIADNFDMDKDRWLVTACVHTEDGINFFRPFYPKYNNMMYMGMNTISSPSVLTIKNENPLMFDEHLTYLMDCDYYYRYYKEFGKPKIIDKICTVNRVGLHQVSQKYKNALTRTREVLHIIFKKYGK